MCNQDKEPVYYLLCHLIVVRFDWSLILGMLASCGVFQECDTQIFLGPRVGKEGKALVFSGFGFDVYHLGMVQHKDS